MSSSRVRVLIAEDSELYAQTILEILESDRSFQVFGVAKDGAEAVRMTELGKPDVVLMDVRMPGMDGLAAIEAIMDRCPTPILVTTADPAGKTGELSFEALRRGALDLVPKPSSWAGTPAEQEDLKQRLLSLSRIKVVRRRAEPPPTPVRAPLSRSLPVPPLRVLGLVASTGGPPVLARVLRDLPEDVSMAVVVVQHLSDGFCPRFASWLGSNTALPVTVATDLQPVMAGTVAVAPDGAHLTLDGRLRLRLDPGPPVGGHRPSGTVLLRSLARAYGRHAMAGVLTGMGDDGAEGLLEVQRAGGFTFVQEPGSCVVAGMPQAALTMNATRLALSPEAMGAELVRIAQPAQGRRG
jgi:two-component system chemotaxis response regulator CheB